MNNQKLISTILNKAANKKRFFLAIAGPPASGKTTLSESLAKELSKQTSVAVVAMDGFHYDNSILQDQNLLDRKGAPQTFDVGGLHLLLSGLVDQTNTLAAPVFDRSQDLSRSSAYLIHPEDHIILVEGNYLLCNTAPWNTLHSFFDMSISLDVSLTELEKRLVQRWLDHDHTQAEAVQRANSNDIPNAKYVLQNAREADYKLVS